ncbi:MAG TPA: NUDIX domain-containing protein [bacterium]|nr:NUDIX domain-containing protein [bacterium]
MSKGGIIDNNKEILDVINENDEVIDQLTKKEIHDGKNILHREIAVLVHDANGNLLLQQRSFKKKYFPGKWTVTAVGHVLAGQNPEEAAHTELKEELGFDTSLNFVEKRKYVSGDHTSLGYLFIGKFPIGQMIVPDPDEVEKAEFFSLDSINKMMNDNSIDSHSIETINKYQQGYYK